ncbi:MAG: trigger factor [Bacteroidales bacterium]|nr:trigger factor [Bacteroidales bacterium]
MNITRENVSDTELSIMVEVVENDYAELVSKQLKRYRKEATLPGFRPGMAPMSLIERRYKPMVVSDEVNKIVSDHLFQYFSDEKLDILTAPLPNDDKNEGIDFNSDKDFAFYFNVAVYPEFIINWTEIKEPLYQIKSTAKDVNNQIEEMQRRYGKFETPNEVGEGDFVYGRVVELDKKGEAKEGGISTFTSFDLSKVKDADIAAKFVGKKVDEKVVFNISKAFTPIEIERILRISGEEAKKQKSDFELTVSGMSHITLAEVNEEFFQKVFPGEEIKDEAAFKKRLQKEIDVNNDEQSRILYVTNVRSAILKQMTMPLPEDFLKRSILRQGGIEEEKLNAGWEETYLPSLKSQIMDNQLSKIHPVNPTRDEVKAYLTDILKKSAKPQDNESDKDFESRLNRLADSIADDENNTRQIVDKLFVEKCFNLFKEQLKPETEKVSIKEFTEKVQR